jgi:TRAP-type C4-dicarboxylate transport system permease small subunit
MLSFIFVLIKYGYEVANVMGIQKSSSMRIPMFYVFLAIPVSGILMLFYTILNMVDLIKGKEERI